MRDAAWQSWRTLSSEASGGGGDEEEAGEESEGERGEARGGEWAR